MGKVRRPKAEVRRSENPELKTQNNRSSRQPHFSRMPHESRVNIEICFTGVENTAGGRLPLDPDSQRRLIHYSDMACVGGRMLREREDVV